MKRFRGCLLLFSSLAILFLSYPLFAQNQPHREIAITIDDLPASNSNSMTGTEINDLTAKLLAPLHDQKVPVVGFVNERKLFKAGEVDARIKALSLWLDNGFELGNHTFSHLSLNNSTLKAWEEEVVRGETVTRYLQSQHNQKMRYFRHPYLDVGRDLETRRDAESFLTQRGYHIAPITMDAWDWMFARVYEDARKRADTPLQQQIASAYLAYTTTVFDYFENFSRDLLGYEPKQILLIHGNWLEADHISELLDLLRKRGYQFVTLQDALGDSAYSLPNEYVGEEGTSWLEQWAITRGKPALNTPIFPQWVIDRANSLPQQPPERAIF